MRVSSESHAAIEALDEVSARLGEAKSARRAYGLTGDVTYQRIYRQAVAAMPERVAAVASLTADSDVQQKSLGQLQPVVMERLARLEAQAAAREATGKEAAPDDVRALENGKLDDSIRRIVSTMVDEEHHLLEAREIASRDRLERGEFIVGISATSACILLLMAFGLVSREVRQRRRAEAATEVALVATKSINAELESFSYSVSHDLRAPLRAIDGFSQALLEDNAAQLDDDGRRHLDRVRAASQRMAQLIDDLLGLSRMTRTMLRSRTSISAAGKDGYRRPSRTRIAGVRSSLRSSLDWLRTGTRGSYASSWRTFSQRVQVHREAAECEYPHRNERRGQRARVLRPR